LDNGHAPVVVEKDFHYDPILHDLCPDDVTLFGFFQSEKWFKDIEPEIRKKQIEPRVLWQNSKEFISEFEKAYEKAVAEYPFNNNLHKFMKPHWHHNAVDQQIAV